MANTFQAATKYTLDKDAWLRCVNRRIAKVQSVDTFTQEAINKDYDCGVTVQNAVINANLIWFTNNQDKETAQ